MLVRVGAEDMAIVEMQVVGLLVGFLFDVVLVLVVPVAGSVRMAVGLVVVVLEDPGVQSFVLIDRLAGDDGVEMVISLPQLLHGLVADVRGIELLVVDLSLLPLPVHLAEVVRRRFL
jgi:hypothetical protein